MGATVSDKIEHLRVRCLLCGDMRTMPGLPSHPAFENVDLVKGRVVGLF